ncbi:RNA 2'-phosphotransferase [Fulvivirgaceae bacterium PWU5]|uniref:Probable RNA 2'-phosphotransferase n=1 Tax=Dawidia cretensis TaxID=2782350 RepID=A0AAP2E3B8_9BACT|nr:RNA 2'-phosphotransferase [Dawidia cretensis]MBT1710957.1 RNA 2'-phosphotransferase [Dawidia cretensis]
MMTEKENTRISKYLSLVLRHAPEAAGITLDENGWTDVGILLKQLNRNGYVVSPAELDHVVTTNNKQRFIYDDDRTRIRASQGHSVAVDLDYAVGEPPAVLYHGTAEAFLPSVEETGLDKRSRHHVHLSADDETARRVGRRHGKPVVLVVDAARMRADGYTFFCSANGVWLTEHVPTAYIQRR